ncbi:hypothetical protein [Salipaludibacillus neizhouensis]|nr:hypothetical protein [Salipaludibacillus neizhouensis]
MNILVSDKQQVLQTTNWLEKMNIPFTHSGNDMNEEEVSVLSSKIDFNSLLEYREAVGKQTQEVISLLSPGQFRMKIEQNRIKQLFDENTVMKNSKWLAEYWSK